MLNIGVIPNCPKCGGVVNSTTITYHRCQTGKCEWSQCGNAWQADYLALQSAFREALDHWDVLVSLGELFPAKPIKPTHRERIAHLRKQFLDEGTT